MTITKNKVDNHHEQYDVHEEHWEVCREFAAGSRVVRASDNIKNYVPPLSDQSNSEYRKYVGRAMFYAATSRTVDGLQGMIFRKPISVSPENDPFFENASADGQPLSTLAKAVVKEILTVGRHGLLVDVPTMVVTHT